MRIFGPKDIKHDVGEFIRKNGSLFAGKTVIDVPAGTGISSGLLKKAGAQVLAYDLFPEFFKGEDIACERADILKGLPAPGSGADVLLCQEGIEHLSDQVAAFREFNRVLKRGGSLLVTTPNYSNLRSKISYLLSESEYAGKLMPPNEKDSVWMAPGNESEGIYLGHIFLTGIQKMRVIAQLNGFRIRRIIPVRLNKTSLWLFPLFYPFIAVINLYASSRSKGDPLRKKIYSEQLRLNLSPQLLLDSHLFVEFEKEMEAGEVSASLKGKYENFDVVT